MLKVAALSAELFAYTVGRVEPQYQFSALSASLMQNIPNVGLKKRLSAAEPAKAKLTLAPLPEKRILNRELSLIEFFRQVLDEAKDERNPPLDRLRFLTIFSSIVIFSPCHF